MIDGGKCTGLGYREKVLDRLVPGTLVAFEWQHILRTLIDDLRGNLTLTTHGIKGNDAASIINTFPNKELEGVSVADN